MPCKNKEDAKAYAKEWYQKNKEKIKEQKREWYQNNKEKRAEWRENNKEKIKEQMKEWHQNNPQSKIKASWKHYGLIHHNYDELYERYCNSTNCEECGCEYGIKGDGTGKFKCMDHCHETGLFRNFLCNRCNIKRG